MEYTYGEIKSLVIKDNGRPYHTNANVYTKSIITWIMTNIKGDSNLQGKVWCIANNLTEVPFCKNNNCNNHTKYHMTFNRGFSVFCGDMSCSSNHTETRDKYKKTSIKNWGVDNPLKNIDHRNSIKNTMKETYGSEYAMQSPVCIDKYKKTSIKNWGVDNPLKSPVMQKICKAAIKKSCGFEYPAQNRDIMKKIMTNKQIRTIPYNNNSKLYYQGTYELYFLDCMNNAGLLHLIDNGLTFKYDFLERVDRLYVSDFFIASRNEIIEIKSKWTYNKRGTDEELKNKNLAKQDCVIGNEHSFIFLIEKIEISKYVNELKKEYGKQ